MSHRQGAIERGFNFNKHLFVENLREISTKGQKLVNDYFQWLKVNLHEYAVPKDFVLSWKLARCKYEKGCLKIKKIKSSKREKEKNEGG